ncbi:MULTISPECIES: pitrilysin family protein [unclassified Brenneria]|uniref:M16 family metallopeptidase n=1 Tax=unclassified Brenneria TaxID=2634434 RepID=UPI0029C5C32B|nr:MULTISPECIES: pitrilysin family protein [unclassified Brenneria]MDX5629983.1 pitrilysin family protein [Brenneria sp. L3-3Z]MDX5697129.1 pitrilysin family protein [Brenneria sp. L4-2C]MEE3664632.1 pitrilysin family protein [Brenneria sp. g21c3]
MQGTKIGLLVGGMLLTVVGGNVQAETLQPDPAWQQGKLDNGFTWQLLTTPQRPGDRVELRLMVNTGSLTENTQQSGFAHFIPRLALTPGDGFSATQLSSLWQPTEKDARSLPPAVTSYDVTFYNLSLPNNRPELLKDALSWLSKAAGQLTIDDRRIDAALNAPNPVVTFPANPQDPRWRYRLKGSPLLAHDPGQAVTAPLSSEPLQQFYKTWYTPDAMTLYIVGHVDQRYIVDQIGKAFSPLQGKRGEPVPVPTLSPLPLQPVSLIDTTVQQDTLSLIWDTPWHPIRDDRALVRYWRRDLAREALFWHVQQALKKSSQKSDNLRFNCNVFYTRAQCAIHIDVPGIDGVMPAMTFLAQELAALRDNGLTQQEFDALIARKTDELGKLFATYARTSTDVLMDQRLRSQQNGVVDIAPEQYQKLRQASLSELTLATLNQELHLWLSQDAALMLIQQQGEPEAHMKELQEAYSRIMAPAEEAEAQNEAAAPAAQ